MDSTKPSSASGLLGQHYLSTEPAVGLQRVGSVRDCPAKPGVAQGRQNPFACCPALGAPGAEVGSLVVRTLALGPMDSRSASY